MTKYYSNTIRIVSIFTLIAFVSTQAAWGYEGRPLSRSPKRSLLRVEQGNGEEIARAIGVPEKVIADARGRKSGVQETEIRDVNKGVVWVKSGWWDVPMDDGIRQYIEGVVKMHGLKRDNKGATGVIFYESKDHYYLLSASHVTNPFSLSRRVFSPKVIVTLSSGRTVQAQIVADSHKYATYDTREVAILKIRKEEIPEDEVSVIPLGDEILLDEAERHEVIVLGYPASKDSLSGEVTKINSLDDEELEEGIVKHRLRLVDKDLEGGYSGSPVIYNGKIVGLYVGWANYAISIKTICDVLEHVVLNNEIGDDFDNFADASDKRAFLNAIGPSQNPASTRPEPEAETGTADLAAVGEANEVSEVPRLQQEAAEPSDEASASGTNANMAGRQHHVDPEDFKDSFHVGDEMIVVAYDVRINSTTGGQAGIVVTAKTKSGNIASGFVPRSCIPNEIRERDLIDNVYSDGYDKRLYKARVIEADTVNQKPLLKFEIIAESSWEEIDRAKASAGGMNGEPTPVEKVCEWTQAVKKELQPVLEKMEQTVENLQPEDSLSGSTIDNLNNLRPLVFEAAAILRSTLASLQEDAIIEYENGKILLEHFNITMKHYVITNISHVLHGSENAIADNVRLKSTIDNFVEALAEIKKAITGLESLSEVRLEQTRMVDEYLGTIYISGIHNIEKYPYIMDSFFAEEAHRVAFIEMLRKVKEKKAVIVIGDGSSVGLSEEVINKIITVDSRVEADTEKARLEDEGYIVLIIDANEKIAQVLKFSAYLRYPEVQQAVDDFLRDV